MSAFLFSFPNVDFDQWVFIGIVCFLGFVFLGLRYR